jgi:hypothetical protein
MYGVSKKGCMAISCVTDAVLGEGSTTQMAYIKIEYTRLNAGDTFFPKSKIVPCNFACAKIPKIGIKTADKQNPLATNHHIFPDWKPNKGGKIRLPAPKNKENRANAVTSVSLLIFILQKIVAKDTRNYIAINMFLNDVFCILSKILPTDDPLNEKTNFNSIKSANTSFLKLYRLFCF